MAELPAGTVTFLFTDIEGSTRLREQHPEAMPAALARHDALLGRAIEAHGGRVFKSIGDQFCAVFDSAPDALAAAHEALDALRAELWDETGSLRVRMALHTGPAEKRGEDYFGATLNRVARLLAAGHGGQILLSQAAASRARASLPDGATLRDLGTHRLKDLQEPERIFQFVPPGAPVECRPLRSLEAFAHNLPRQTTRFIGRWPEMAAVRQLLSDAAILTLTGAGGCGKTRLALQVAAELVEEYPDGVWLVELAALSDPDLLVGGMAAALGLREDPQRPVLSALMDYLRPRSLLLLLDNCEHLLAACAGLVDTLMRGCPQLRVLATSREALGVPGEQTYRVPSLSLPPLEGVGRWAGTREAGGGVEPRGSSGSPNAQRLTPDAVSQFEAVQLFRDRASLSEPSFALTEASGPHVVQVCRRLDGIPLAIELAAARLKAVPVEQLAARLDDRFRLLTGGCRTALPRQQTLRACLDWSYNLLSEQERVMLRRLSVFAGGWTLEAAEAICSDFGLPAKTDGPDPPMPLTLLDPIQNPKSKIQNEDVLELMAALINKSLVTRETGKQETRYSLLEIIRQYAGEKLLESESSAGLRRRHRDWYLALAETAEIQLLGPGRMEWLERMEAEHPNLRAALDGCAREDGEAEAEQRLAGAAARFWASAGYCREGGQRLAAALSRPGGEQRTAARAKALLGATMLTCLQGDCTTAYSLCEESLAIGEELGERALIARSLAGLGVVAYVRGDFPRARQCYEGALMIHQEMGDRPAAARVSHSLGIIAHEQGDVERAQGLYEESLATAREVGDPGNIAYLLDTLGSLRRNQGAYTRARACHQESLAIYRETPWDDSLAFCLVKLGLVAHEQGDLAQAHSLFEEALATCRAAESPYGIAGALICMAVNLAEQGDVARARDLGEEGLAIYQKMKNRPSTSWALANLAGIARQAGDLPRARALYEESLAVSRPMDQKEGIAAALAGLGDLDLVDGEAEAAHQSYRESLTLFSQMGYRRNIAAGLVGLARVAEAFGQPARGARLLGAAQALLEAIGARLGVVDRTEQERCEAAVRAQLGEAAFATAWAEGRAMTLERAIATALLSRAKNANHIRLA